MQNDSNANERSERQAESQLVIPVIEEQVNVDVQTVDTAKILVQKKIVEEQVTVDVPLLHETYDVERIPVNRIVDTPPSMHEEGNVTIIPVIREVIVKRYEIVEEIRLTKKQQSVPHQEEITVKKEEVRIERMPLTAEQNHR